MDTCDERGAGRRAYAALVMAVLLLGGVSPQARAAEARAAEAGAAGAPLPDTVDASIGNSAVRGLTYKTGTFLTNLLAFSYLTGSALDGTGMSALITAYSYGSYVATDYLWDTLYPRSAEARTPQEVLEESAWRTTAKFVTYKAVNMPVMLGLSYYATGTGAGAVGLYAGLSVFKAGLFYANNMIWDYYDAYAGPARPAAPAAAAP